MLERARTALAAIGTLRMLALTVALGRGTLLRSSAVIGLVTGEWVGLGGTQCGTRERETLIVTKLHVHIDCRGCCCAGCVDSTGTLHPALQICAL